MLGPIFSVEIVTSARRWRQYIVRVFYAAILLGALWTTYESSVALHTIKPLAQTANVAAQFFQRFSWMQLFTVVLVGPALAAGTIAVERERRTIEYLFATDLTNREIIFGKLAAQLVQLGCVVLAGIPVLALAMLMGGIAPEQLVAVLLITLSTLIVVTVLAVTVSVWSPRSRDALMRIYLILFAVLLLPVIVKPMLTFTTLSPWVQPLYGLYLVNPFTTLWNTTWAGMGLSLAGSNIYWDSVWELLATHGVVTLILAGLSTWAVRRVHLRDSGKAPNRVRTVMASHRRGPGNHPMLWKELVATRILGKFGIAARIAIWGTVICMLFPSIYAFFTAPLPRPVGPILITADLLSCGLLLLIAGRAASSITSERERDTWATLLSTPLSSRDIIVAKMLGTIYAARWLFVLLVFVWTLPIFLKPELLFGIPFTFVALTIIAFFAVAMGTNYSLRLRNSMRAMGAALGTGLFVGGGYLFCCAPLMVNSARREVMMAGFVPFLLAIPFEVIEHRNWNSRMDEVIASFTIGTTLYLVAATLIVVWIIGSFDRANERIPEI